MYLQACSLVLLLLVSGTSSRPGALCKLIRARKDIGVPHVYFVHMKESILSEDIHAFIEELVSRNSLEKDRVIETEDEGSTGSGFGKQEIRSMEESIEGFVAEVHGSAVEAAHGFSAKLSPSALNWVLRNPNVEIVEQDHYIKAGEVVYRSSWGVDRLDQEDTIYDNRYALPCNLTGDGVDIYLLDSGVHYSHNEFDGRAVYPGCDPVDQLFGSSPKNGSDCTGHGTHVAGTIAGVNNGVAPGATIFSMRVLDCTNLGTENTLILGIECVLKKYQERQRPAVVNLSIYGEKNLAVKTAIDNMMKKGISVVSIAGNNELKPKDSCKVSPGSIHGVITVSASTKKDQAYSLSNAGSCVDLYAPGTDIYSATHVCDTCGSIRTGSSMAAPHVTGAIALLLEKCPNIPPWRVRHLLLTQMVQANVLSFKTLPNRFLATTPNLLLHTSSLQCDVEC